MQAVCRIAEHAADTVRARSGYAPGGRTISDTLDADNRSEARSSGPLVCSARCSTSRTAHRGPPRRRMTGGHISRIQPLHTSLSGRNSTPPPGPTQTRPPPRFVHTAHRTGGRREGPPGLTLPHVTRRPRTPRPSGAFRRSHRCEHADPMCKSPEANPAILVSCRSVRA